MYVLNIAIASLFLLIQDPKPVAVKRSMKIADRVAASARIDPGFWSLPEPSPTDGDETLALREQYTKAIETIRNAEAFAAPIKVSVTIESVTVNDDSSISISGTFHGRKKDLGAYRTTEEWEIIEDFDHYTEDKKAKYRATVRLRRFPNAGRRTRAGWLESDRAHEHYLKDRRRQRTRLLNDLNRKAELRQG